VVVQGNNDLEAQRARAALLRIYRSPESFSRRVLGRPLRPYQLAPARAIIDSVLHARGLTIAVMMARQAGKNETAAHVEAYLLNRFRRRGGTFVKAAPTFDPQVRNSVRRLRSVWRQSALGPLRPDGASGLVCGRARAQFRSASPRANVVGATADILLEADEAQDIDEAHWNKAFRPMAASTNATTVLWGTAWTADTLLANTIRRLEDLQARDGRQRVFRTPWQQVAEVLPAYGRYVRGEIDRLGAEHPLILTQYALRELRQSGGMFPEAVQSMMRGTHPPCDGPEPGHEYALCIDVAGEAEDRLEGELLRDREPRRDATAATLVEVLRHAGDLQQYRVCARHHWLGRPHHELYGTLLSLVERWSPYRVVVDATGVGAGLASFLRGQLGARVRPFLFTSKTKSDLGWDFLAICRSGRFRDHLEDGSPAQGQFWREVAAADYAVGQGPNRLMRWGVADPTVHDDLLISAALCALLDREGRRPPIPSVIIEAPDMGW